MSFNIQNFNSNLNQYGVSKQSHFEVFFPLHNGDQRAANGQQLNLGFRCETAMLPGQSIATVENRTYGPQRKMAYGNIYTDMSFSLLCSTNLREKVFFDDWVNYIVGVNSSTNNHTYDVKYFIDYARPVNIKQFDPNGKVIYSVNLIQAYPLAVSPLSLNHDSSDVHKLSVTMTYHRWELDHNWVDGTLPQPKPAMGLGSFLGGWVGPVLGVASGFLPSRAAQILGASTAIPNIARNLGF